MTIRISQVQAICFDVDGTLRDTDDQVVAKLARMLRPMRRILPHSDQVRAARNLVMTLEDPGTFLFSLTDRLNIDHHMNRLFEKAAKIRSGQPPASGSIIPGVVPMLQFLHKHYPLAIVSARGEFSTRFFLEQNDLLQYFQVVVSGQTCQHTKPYPEPVLYAAKEMGVPPENCLMVGDTTVDIRAGRLAGAQTVGVLCGFGEQKELIREGADLILAATPQLTGYFSL